MLRKVSSEFGLTSRICILHTGGTLGMVKSDSKAYIPPPPGNLREKLKTFCPLYDPTYELEEFALLTDHEPLATPVSMYGRRIIYCIEELNPLLDSANMSMSDWARIGKLVEKYYRKFDGFVIIHGTDTMAYSASALSFMLENLGKSVILTGAQIPIEEQRSDGVNNLLGALIFASHYTIPEVCIYFNNCLYRGNRSIKKRSDNINAFDSPNMTPLGAMGTHVTVNWNNMIECGSLSTFKMQEDMCADVAMLRLFPGITKHTIHQFMQPPIRGIVLLSYGAGNGPDGRKEILEVFAEACSRGILILNITQCLEGTVSIEYNTGKVLLDAGILPGGDMTPEAALAKLSYVLAKPGLDLEEQRKLITSNIRGEMSVEVSPDFTSLLINSETYLGKYKSHRLLTIGSQCSWLISSLDLTSRSEMLALRDAILPTVMCSAAGLGNLEKLQEAVEQRVSVNKADYDGRTPLHLAACEGQYNVVEYLLSKGASVHSRDRFGSSPFEDAIKNKHYEVVKLMVQTGAHLHYSDKQAADAVCLSILNNDPGQIKMWKMVGVKLDSLNSSGFTPLHMCVMMNQAECYSMLIQCGADVQVADETGMSVPDMIKALNRPAFDHGTT